MNGLVGNKPTNPFYYKLMDDFDKQFKLLNYKRQLAVRRESEIRETALLPMRFDLMDVEVNQFTPLHYILLDFADNPHISGEREPTLDDTIQFLWVVSPEYKHKDKVAFEKFKEQHAGLDNAKMIEEIYEYLSYSLLDLNSVSTPENKPKTNKAPNYAWIIPYIDTLASQYGWTDDYILSLPFARILQYARAIEERLLASNGSKAMLANKLSDGVTKEILTLVNDKAKGEGKVVVTPDDEKKV